MFQSFHLFTLTSSLGGQDGGNIHVRASMGGNRYAYNVFMSKRKMANPDLAPVRVDQHISRLLGILAMGQGTFYDEHGEHSYPGVRLGHFETT